MIVLDYFLEHGKTGKDLIIEAKRRFGTDFTRIKVIGFSSIEKCSMEIARITNGYGLKKNKEASDNKKLREIIIHILSSVSN